MGVYVHDAMYMCRCGYESHYGTTILAVTAGYGAL